MQGPDFVWHLDGYDKLKPYGFAIHGCIDGYVTCIDYITETCISHAGFLEKLYGWNCSVQTTILMLCQFYIYQLYCKIMVCKNYYNVYPCQPIYNKCIFSSPLGCPSILRADCGTENTTLAATHMAMRHKDRDEFSGSKSFRFGSSTTNTVRFSVTPVLLSAIYVHTVITED